MQPSLESEHPTDYLTIAQVIVSGFGMIVSLGLAAIVIVIGLIGLFGGTIDWISATTVLSFGWVSLLMGALAGPSLFFSIRRLMGTPSATPRLAGFRMVNIALLLWPLVLVLGNLIAGESSLAWLLLPPLQLLAVGLPVWWVFELARYKIYTGSHQRGWGIFNFSVFITTPAVMAAELVLFGGLLAAFVAWLMQRPDLLSELEALSTRLLTMQDDPDAILALLAPYIQNPLVIFGALALIAGVIPLLEELLKPLALWPLASRGITPAQGFVAGALCGAAFALLESLLSLSGPAVQGWAQLALGRAGTALLHITASALIGWAMADAWQRGAYLRLVLVYLLSSVLHGVWNMFSLLYGLNTVLEGVPEEMQAIALLGRIAPIGIIILAILIFFVLLGINRRLRNMESAEVQPALTSP
jgi:hypothetical protein